MGASYLDTILARKRLDLKTTMASRPLAEVARLAEAAPPTRGFIAALRRGRRLGLDGSESPALIGELKKASPSRGLIRPDFEPARLAAAYRRGGASALSVLTDEPFFQGTPEYLALAREASGLPTLRKDFLIEPYQVYEARAMGADAVLLIAAALEGGRLGEMLRLSTDLGLDALVEVHDRDELARALGAGAALIGINNRDLRTFQTDLRVTEDLAPLVPADVLVVSESGIHTRQDLLRVARAGAGAALVGEALMRHADVTAAAAALLSRDLARPELACPWVKICGHTGRDSVQAAVDAGAAAVGFVFAPSRRRVTPEAARDLGRGLPPWAERVGVFAAEEAAGSAGAAGAIAETVRQAALTGVQLHGCRGPEPVARIRRAVPRGIRVIAAVSVSGPDDLASLKALAAAGADAVLLDTAVPGQLGGTGRRFDWTLAAQARRVLGSRVPVYLAGGLTPENVGEALRQSGADGLDVSSGVETNGVKDPDRIRAFLEAARCSWQPMLRPDELRAAIG